MKHFRLAAVMHDEDVLKRPIFRNAGPSKSADFESEGVSCSTSSPEDSATGQATRDIPASTRPRYVHVAPPVRPLAKRIADSTFCVEFESTVYGG
mmetsp:Transcript_41848/g.91303  ORF Transcript_41848/g.91303 Transcript_41848/m.91303 type:complete len:95 (-) Transcript_41848:454-738(-)